MRKQVFDETKKFMSVLMIIFCFLILTTVPMALCSENAPNEVTMPTYTLSPIPINEKTNYQDIQWLKRYIADSLVISNDMKYLGTALMNITFPSNNSNFVLASKYANILYKDTQKALNNSGLYNVSSDLQSAKDEYQLEVLEAQSAAVYISHGTDAYRKGKVEVGDSDMEKAVKSLHSVVVHANRTASLLKTYKSN